MPLYINETDKNQMVHFGHGDLVVSTSEDATEVIFTPSSKGPGEIGADTSQFYGKVTTDIAPGVRLVFDNHESALVVIEALEKVYRCLKGKTGAVDA